MLTLIANEIAPRGSGVDSSGDCSRVLTLIVKRIELYLDRYGLKKPFWSLWSRVFSGATRRGEPNHDCGPSFIKFCQ